MIRYIREQYDSKVKIIAIEPFGSDCLYKSMKDYKAVAVEDCPDTIMVGLDCGVLSDIAWPVLN
jgi:threonine dehydratase